jgi:hypothetical protein
MENRRNVLKTMLGAGVVAATGAKAMGGDSPAVAKASTGVDLSSLPIPKDFIHKVSLQGLCKFISGKETSDTAEEIIKNWGFGHHSQLFINFLNLNFTLCEKKGYKVESIVCPPEVFAMVRVCGKDMYDEATRREIEQTGIYGYIWTSNLRVEVGMKEIVFACSINDKSKRVV